MREGAESAKLRFLPVGLSVQGKQCVVVGGGRVGTRKVRNLLRAGASVTVIDCSVSDELGDLARDGTIRWINALFEESQLDGTFLAVAATDDEPLNAAIVEAAQARGALVCDASASERSQVIFGALLAAGGRTVAVFSDGRDPTEARATRDRIAKLLKSEHAGGEAD